MSLRVEAQELLQKMHYRRSRSFFGKIDESQRVMNIVLVHLKNADHEVLVGSLQRR